MDGKNKSQRKGKENGVKNKRKKSVEKKNWLKKKKKNTKLPETIDIAE